MKLGAAFKKLIKSFKKEDKEKAKVTSVVPAFCPDPDQVRFSGFPEDVNLTKFKAWLDENGINFLDTMVFQGNKPGCFSIETIMDADTEEKFSIDNAEAQTMVLKLNGFQYQKRTISVNMAQMTTPEKIRKKPTVVTLSDSSGDDTLAAAANGEQLALPAPVPSGETGEPTMEAAEVTTPKTPSDDDGEEDNEDEMGESPGSWYKKTPEDDNLTLKTKQLKLKIQKDVTASGTAIGRVVGTKAKRGDVSSSSLEASPELTKPPLKKKNGGSKGVKK